MNRRQLFAALGAVALAPDELWTPPRKIFLPPLGGWVREVSGDSYARCPATVELVFQNNTAFLLYKNFYKQIPVTMRDMSYLKT